MSKIVFLDFDGPLMPFKAVFQPNQRVTQNGLYLEWDKTAVGLVNRLCKLTSAKITVHSSWRKPTISGDLDIKAQMISQGLDPDHFHTDLIVPLETNGRYEDIQAWLLKHSDISDYVILDDMPAPKHFENKTCLVEFNEGFNWERYNYALELLGGRETAFAF